jgi:hypothetical protein
VFPPEQIAPTSENRAKFCMDYEQPGPEDQDHDYGKDVAPKIILVGKRI